MMSRSLKTDGARMVYLIKRKTDTSREELVAHWFANHMPGVIARNASNQARNLPHARQYVATLFDQRDGKPNTWDGVAQLWYDAPLRRPEQASAVKPYDTFQQKVEPYWPWATQEFLIMDGALPLEPLTLNSAFPCTRSGFFKVTFLLTLGDGADRDSLFAHWLDIHVPNVQKTMEAVGGFRYAVGHSLEPETEPFVGMAELYFQDASDWDNYRDHFKPDGFEDWIDINATLRFYSGTEMVGIE